jgi:hypothetical protein
MLLRKFMVHLKRQDWLAVAIDFMIVVFGVFLGLQVSEWNQARQDRALERGYIARISHDIARSRAQIVQSNDAMQVQAEGAGLVMRALDTCRVPRAERDAFARALYNLGKFDTATLDETAIDELKSTGRSNVLRSVELREALSALGRAVELQHRIEPQFRDRTSPFVNHIQFLVQFDVRSPEATAGSTITWERMRINMPEVCADPRFRASVSAVRDMTFQIIAYNEQIMAQMDAATTRLDEQ